MPDAFDVDAWLDDYTPPVVEARVSVPLELRAEHQRLERDLRAAILEEDEAKAKKLARDVIAVEAQVEASGAVFSFQGCSDIDYADLLRDHPPTEEQAKQYDHNPDTFPNALIADCSWKPKLTRKQADRVRATLSPADWEQLFRAAVAANKVVATPPKSQMAIGVLRLNGVSSTTSAPAASPGKRSSANGAGRSQRSSTTKKPAA